MLVVMRWMLYSFICHQMGGHMKRFICLLLSFLAFFYTIRSVACPTCVGLPQKGSRPFFERGTIIYTYQNNTQNDDSTKESENKPEPYNPLEDEEC